MSNTTSIQAKNKFDNRILGKDAIWSNDSRQNGGLNANVLVLGGSGTGKSGSYLYSNLKLLNNQSAVVCDTKGTLFNMFKDELEAKNYKVSSINMVSPKLSTCGFNPLDYLCDSEGNISQREIVRFSQALIPTCGQHEEPVWTQGAQGIWQFITSYCLEALPKEDHSISTLISLYHALIKSSGMSAFSAFSMWINEHPNSYSAQKYYELMANAKAEKMFSSYLGFLNNVCNTLALPELKQIFENEKLLDIRDIGRTKQVVFITVPDTDDSLDCVCNLIYTQIIQQLILEADANKDGCLEVPTTIYMDDAGNYKIPSLEKIISISRSRQLGISLLLQSCSQLNSSYGKEKATTIIDNMDSIVYLGSNNIETANFIGTRAFKTLSNVLNMSRDMCYILISGMPAIQTSKIPPYSFEVEVSDDTPDELSGSEDECCA